MHPRNIPPGAAVQIHGGQGAAQLRERGRRHQGGDPAGRPRGAVRPGGRAARQNPSGGNGGGRCPAHQPVRILERGHPRRQGRHGRPERRASDAEPVRRHAQRDRRLILPRLYGGYAGGCAGGHPGPFSRHDRAAARYRRAHPGGFLQRDSGRRPFSFLRRGEFLSGRDAPGAGVPGRAGPPAGHPVDTRRAYAHVAAAGRRLPPGNPGAASRSALDRRGGRVGHDPLPAVRPAGPRPARTGTGVSQRLCLTGHPAAGMPGPAQAPPGRRDGVRL